MKRPLIVGLGITGRAVTDALVARGIAATLVDDRPGDAVIAWADTNGHRIHSPDAAGLAALVGEADAILPAPGLPDHHPVFALAASAGVPVRSEFDLAAEWDDRPIVAVTGTDGKTTVVTLIERMLDASDIAALAVGNTDVPLVAAIGDPDWDTFVVEASSFRLLHSDSFSPAVAAWLNFGPDHLDAHRSMQAYEDAKASIWARLGPTSTAVANADDPVVMRHARELAADQVVTFGTDERADCRVLDDSLCFFGDQTISIADCERQLPHDLANYLAAGIVAIRAGATWEAVAATICGFRGLEHRVETVADIDGVRWINDSKATTPHATEAAVKSWPSLVLIAGGRNKGLDLSGLAALADRITHVITIGEAADALEVAFDGRTEVINAEAMERAVAVAADLAVAGQAVVLSPACASYDQYASYRHRGDHFRKLVLELQERVA